MSDKIIQTMNDGTKSWVQTTSLAGVDFRLSFAWNSVTSMWSLTVSDIDDNVLVSCMTLSVGARLNRGFAVQPNNPQGSFFIASSDAKDDSPPGLYDLGNRCLLMFVEGE